ncbi:uncharacterized protein LOC135923113 [Gordionus sp. m RMFG-2023]|uniref:uncharacterized protein LOC135923113 n=1 Tax=Gordionus sp. m RMFG-2023 TaxID=3053472 RepID=UPI0031FC70A1
MDDFPGVIFAHSRPRHPETNGLIERANGTLESRISGYMLETKKYDWATALPKIVFNINLGFSRTIKNTPFNVFFARTPYSVDSEPEVIPEIVNVDSDHEEMNLVHTIPTSSENSLIEYDPDEISLVHTLPRLSSSENSLIEYDPDEISLIQNVTPSSPLNDNLLIDSSPDEMSKK